ncbi:hypothetical protein J2Y38_004585 [Flavobacterium sp. 2755]|uniref:hypothetical protein n=1 Tax=Flavobacterium sp. 2755 TaxID=2817765 RepID=UPI0028619195|nr:hypothetical protein [Flavobacterium sp. 2755]MDR6764352.1 hypothetical protein [Flavobacterium sp. 2755]
MTLAYFLTGSYNDIDNDFELHITIEPKTDENNTASQHFKIVLTDISSENKLLWETAGTSFLLCLKDLEEFLDENHITLYSKILTSSQRDKAVDKELEGFILNRLEY